MCKLFEKDSLYFEPKINPVRRARKLEHENIMENIKTGVSFFYYPFERSGSLCL